MKAIAKIAPSEGVSLIDLKEPVPGPNDVVYALEAASICGSDVTMYRWTGWAKGLERFLPFVLGHEVCGTVTAVGSQVEHIRVGERISVETHIPCGRCWYCTHGRAHVCSEMVIYGHQVNGAFCQFGCAPASAVWKIAPDISSELAALMEPLGVATHALDSVAIEGQPLAIIGAGPIGLLVTAVASTRKPEAIIVIEPEKNRRDLALKVGATTVIDPKSEKPTDVSRAMTQNVGVEVVVACSGHIPAVLESIAYVRTCGRLVMIGNPHTPLSLDVGQQIIHKELHIQGVWGLRLWQTWKEVEAFIRKYPEKLRTLITARYPLAEGCAAMERAGTGKDGKILLMP